MMKKYYSFLIAAVIIALTVSLSACGDENDEPKNNSLVGYWKDLDDDEEIHHFHFTSDGKWNEVFDYEPSRNRVYWYSGTYETKGNKLYLTVKKVSYSGDDFLIGDVEEKVFTFENSKLVIKNADDGLVYGIFLRIKETEVNSIFKPYL